VLLRLLRRVVAHRVAVVAVVSVVLTVFDSWGVWEHPTDWSLLQQGGALLFSTSALHTYALTPGLQAGPLTLVLTGALNLVFGAGAGAAAHLLLAAEPALLLWLAERAAAESLPALARVRRHLPVVATVGGLLLASAWGVLAGATGHVDDGLALLAFAVAIRAVAREHALSAALWAGVAVDAKPWALGCLALLVGLRHGRVRAAAIAIAVPVVSWLPFLADPRNLTVAAHQEFPVSRDAPLHVLGLMHAFAPTWQRPVELLAIAAAAAYVGVRRCWIDAFAASMVVRLLTEITMLEYYDVDTLFAVLLTDIAARRTPWRSGLLWLLAYPGRWLDPSIESAFRLLVLVVLAASYVASPRLGRRCAQWWSVRLSGAAQRIGPLLAS
jgi:hypothetical protein